MAAGRAQTSGRPYHGPRNECFWRLRTMARVKLNPFKLSLGTFSRGRFRDMKLQMKLVLSFVSVVTHPAALRNFTWKKHCGGLFELPVAA